MDHDHHLIQEIVAGRKELYRELVSRYQHKVFSVALKIAGNTKDAEDIAQEAFIQAYRSLPSFRNDASFSTWLYRIAISKGMDWKRRQKSSINASILHEREMADENEPIPENWLIENEKIEDVRKMVQHLPEKYQSVVSLYHFENMSYQEIANHLGIAKKTVESRLYRAKSLMKDIWEKEGLG